MKNILFCIVFALISNVPLCAQDLDFGDIMGAATEFVNEAQGTAETQADNQSMGNIVQELLHKTDDPVFKGLMEKLSQALKEFENESYTGKCLQVMGAYAKALAHADRNVELAGNACEKKEWLGAEGLLLLAGGTINYCPTEFYGLSDESLDENEQKEIITRYEAEIYIYFYGRSAGEIFKIKQEIDEKSEKEHIKNYILRNNPDRNFKPDELEKLVNVWYDLDLAELLEDKIVIDSKIKPHLDLLLTFQEANLQLGLFDMTGGAMIDFVGKMFTPEFMLSKTIEIAKLSNLYKCSN